jgi:hypothetical protein
VRGSWLSVLSLSLIPAACATQVRWHSNNHTNEVTRLWANGSGSECLPAFVVGVDPGLRDIIGHNENGRYIDNTAIAPVIRAAIEQRPCPVPGM